MNNFFLVPFNNSQNRNVLGQQTSVDLEGAIYPFQLVVNVITQGKTDD